ncbi:MAG: S24/S26 family peptidase [Thermoguttaceae bacterium]|nr:S24/S26 family peptidase [Thermoguttaceae bacterium]
MSESARPVVLIPGKELFPILREAFERDPDAVVALTTSGLSMYPMLRHRKDVVYLTKLHAPPKKYDVVLFQRESGAYALHRVVRVDRDGTFVFCGDNQTELERGIRDDQLVAVVESFRRSGVRIDCRKSIAYALYARLQTSSRLLRKAARAVVGRFKRPLKYLLQKKKRPGS